MPMIRGLWPARPMMAAWRHRLSSAPGVVSLCFMLGTLACHAESATDAATGGADVSDGDSWLPDECQIEQSPFLSPDCLGALRGACGGHGDESACAAEPMLSFDNDGYIIRCVWAKVVRFSDASLCTVASVGGRCEASVQNACGDACAGNFLVSNLSAIPDELELIEMCGGPLGPWAAVGSEPGSYLSVCEPGLVPAPDPLCDCAQVACNSD